MTFSKLYDTHAAAVADITHGATLLIAGAASGRGPTGLLRALAEQGAGNLTVVCDLSDWDASEALINLVVAGRVTRIISPYPIAGESGRLISELQNSNGLKVDTVPPGTLAERLRAAGAGIGGFFVPVGLATGYAHGKETRVINGVDCVLESPLHADFALLSASTADSMGNLVYGGAQRGWNSVMATAAKITIVEADKVGEPGIIDPELVVTPGIYVNRIVQYGTAHHD